MSAPYTPPALVGNAEQHLREIEASRPCLDAETTDADLAEWVRTSVIPVLERAGLL